MTLIWEMIKPRLLLRYLDKKWLKLPRINIISASSYVSCSSDGTEISSTIPECCNKFVVASVPVGIQSILKALGEGEKKKNLDLDLDQCSLQLTEGLVLHVLQKHRHDWKVSLSFFRWASSRSDCHYGSRVYKEILDTLGKEKQTELMLELFEEMPKLSDNSSADEKIFEVLLNRLAGAHRISDAIDIFYRRKEYGLTVDATAFHLLLRSLCRYKHVEEAEELLIEKQAEFPPDIKSRNIILMGWSVVGSYREVKRFWKDTISSGCKPDLHTYGTLVNSMAKAGKVTTTLKLLDVMSKKGIKPDVVIYNCVIDGLCFKKRIPEALNIFSEMGRRDCQPDSTTYNTLIKHFCKIGRIEKAHELLKEMEQKEFQPTSITFTHFLTVAKDPNEVMGLLERMTTNGCQITADVCNLLLKLNLRWNNEEGIHYVWNEMERNGLGPDSRSYTLMIHGLHSKGRLDDALRYFYEMQSKGLVGSPQTLALVKDIATSRSSLSSGVHMR